MKSRMGILMRIRLISGPVELCNLCQIFCIVLLSSVVKEHFKSAKTRQEISYKITSSIVS